MTVQQSKYVAYVITLCNKNSCADCTLSISQYVAKHIAMPSLKLEKKLETKTHSGNHNPHS